METLWPDDTSTSVSRSLPVMEPSSLITVCQIGGHYSLSDDDCVEVLQPKRVNCSGMTDTVCTLHVSQNESNIM